MDVSKENFNSSLSKILSDIKTSAFVAVDTEFTGILTNELFQRSYFDSGTSLYHKECKNLENVAILQIGISTFKGLIDSNKYLVNTYNIYVRPHSVLCVNENILWQVANLEFLNQHEFDFKKWAVEGIPCLNADQETEVRKFYAEILSDQCKIFVPYEVLDKLELVKMWAKDSETGDSMVVQLSNDTNVLLFFSSLLSSELNVIPTYQNDKVSVIVTESVEEEKIKLEAERAFETILDRLKGFVKVFDVLVDSKVPLILHNGMLDILLIYKQFHRSLPKSYYEFKENVHKMFPLVYDTKQLAHILGSKLKSREEKDQPAKSILRKTDLASVKDDLESQTFVLYRPSLQHSTDTPKYSNGSSRPHEAGYDAFCTGYCFLHLSHIYAMYQYERVDYHRPLSPRELIHVLKQWSNEIPVQKAGINFMLLDGQNPRVKKYTWLVIESRSPFTWLTPEGIAATLSTFGQVDVVRRNRRSVMVASSSKFTSDNIMQTFGDNKHVTVSKYRPIKHSFAVRSFVWSWALLSTGISTWLLYKTWKNVKS